MSFDEKLIELVRGKSIIYDLKHLHYRRTDLKTKIWREIAFNLKSTEHECKTRWKSLRDVYRRARRQVPNSGDPAPNPDDVDTQKKKWKYFDLMSFLYNVDDQRPTIGNYHKESSDSCDLFESSIDYTDVGDNSTSLSLNDVIGTSTPAKQAKMSASSSKNDIHTNFKNFLDIATKSISEIDEPAKATSTSLLFSSLAMKIQNAQLPVAVVHELEMDVSNIVYSKLREYYDD